MSPGGQFVVSPDRPQPVPHQALAAIGQLYALHRGQERLGLRLDGLGKQPVSGDTTN